MRLYYAPHACSLALDITSREAGLALDLVKVNVATHTLDDGTDYLTINPRGYVPVLEMDDGERFTETSVLIQYLADRGENRDLLPAAGTRERLRVQCWLNFVATELHKTFTWLWRKGTPEQTASVVRDKLCTRFAELETLLGSQPYLTGNRFTVADAYAFTVIGWSTEVNFDLSSLPNLRAYLERIGARPAVTAALRAESA